MRRTKIREDKRDENRKEKYEGKKEGRKMRGGRGKDEDNEEGKTTTRTTTKGAKQTGRDLKCSEGSSPLPPRSPVRLGKSLVHANCRCSLSS